MKKLRFLVAVLIVWLFLFYNIERLSKPVNITDIAYTFVPIVAGVVMLLPRLRKLPLVVLLVIPVAIFIFLKTVLKTGVWGVSLPLTVMEICIIVVTTLLARLASGEVGAFENAVANITIGGGDQLAQPLSLGQGEMYREVKRARHYQRPLAMIAVGVEEESLQVALDRIVKDVQQGMMKRYVLSSVAKALCDELEDYNVVAQSNSHFVVLLPEVGAEQLPGLVNRLRQMVSRRIGVTLQTGLASFPEDGVTFESLMQKALDEMHMEEKRKDNHALRSQPVIQGRQMP